MNALVIFWLGFAAVPEGATPKAVMVAPAVGVSQRLSDVTQDPHKPTLPAQLNVPGAHYWGLFKICVSTDGAVDTVGIMRSTGQPEALDARWTQAVKTWRYKPYQINGQVVPFCHPVRIEVGTAPTPPAANPDGGAPAGTTNKELTLAPKIGAGLRLSDVTQAPYRPTLPKELNRAGNVFWGLFKVCVAATGQVSGIGVIKGTGEPALLDRRWMAAMKLWRYRPYTVDGKPVPFCHPVRLQVTSTDD